MHQARTSLISARLDVLGAAIRAIARSLPASAAAEATHALQAELAGLTPSSAEADEAAAGELVRLLGSLARPAEAV